MTRIARIGRCVGVCVVLASVMARPTPVLAQAQGRVTGTVVDHEGRPVAEATVTMDHQDAARHVETTTNDRGQFVQIGLPSGRYTVTVAKEGLVEQTVDISVRQGPAVSLDVELVPADVAAVAAMTPAERERLARTDAASDAVNRGVEARGRGDYDEAIARFNEALEEVPECADCYHNLGVVYAEQEEYARAESAFKRAIELNPAAPGPYQGLVGVYNAQRRFDEAAEAGAQAAQLSTQGTGAAAVFDQGIIFWNAGRIADAKKQFEDTLVVDPNHGEAHYWLGMANLNEGSVAEAVSELKIYLEREPNGRFAAEATAILSQIQP